MLCILRSHTCVPISWTCKKQTAVPHNSTEAELISCDAGLRLEGIPAVIVWDRLTDVLEPQAERDHMRNIKPKKTKLLMADKRLTDSIGCVLPKLAHLRPKSVFVCFR